jgi:hypothetical protein
MGRARMGEARNAYSILVGKPERRGGLAEHISPATFGSVDKNRIALVSIQRKPLYHNRGNASAIQQIVGSLI